MTSRTVSNEAIKALDEIAITPEGKSPFQQALINRLRDVLNSPLAKEVDGYILFFMDRGQMPRPLPAESLKPESRLRDEVLAELWMTGTQSVAETPRGARRLAGLLNKWERCGNADGADAAGVLRDGLERLRQFYGADTRIIRHHNILRQTTSRRGFLYSTPAP